MHWEQLTIPLATAADSISLTVVVVDGGHMPIVAVWTAEVDFDDDNYRFAFGDVLPTQQEAIERGAAMMLVAGGIWA